MNISARFKADFLSNLPNVPGVDEEELMNFLVPRDLQLEVFFPNENMTVPLKAEALEFFIRGDEFCSHGTIGAYHLISRDPIPKEVDRYFQTVTRYPEKSNTYVLFGDAEEERMAYLNRLINENLLSGPYYFFEPKAVITDDDLINVKIRVTGMTLALPNFSTDPEENREVLANERYFYLPMVAQGGNDRSAFGEQHSIEYFDGDQPLVFANGEVFGSRFEPVNMPVTFEPAVFEDDDLEARLAEEYLGVPRP